MRRVEPVHEKETAGQGTVLRDLPLQNASREKMEAVLARIYSPVRVLEHPGAS